MKSHLTTQQAEQAQLQLADMLNSLGAVSEDSGFSQIASILALPDDQFMIIQEQFLFETEKELNDPNQELFLVQSLNSTGTKVEDLLQSYEGLIKEIDGELTEVLSAAKRTFLKRLIFMMINAISRTEGISKRIIIIPTEVCAEGGDLPVYAHLTDAGADLVALEDITIHPGEQKIIPTGIKVAIPLGYALLVQPRSGLSSKTKLRIANTPGLIDSGYRGEIGVILENVEPPIKDISYEFNEDGTIKITSILHGNDAHISKGQKFAQLRLVEAPRASYYQIDDINEIDSDRGVGGFGSTDKEVADAVNEVLEKEAEDNNKAAATKVIDVPKGTFTEVQNEQDNN